MPPHLYLDAVLSCILRLLQVCQQLAQAARPCTPQRKQTRQSHKHLPAAPAQPHMTNSCRVQCLSIVRAWLLQAVSDVSTLLSNAAVLA